MIDPYELEEKLEFWKPIIGLGSWDVKYKLVTKTKLNEILEKIGGKKVDKDDIVLGAVVESYPSEQAASIMFLKDADKEFGFQINLDTLILHELIHVVMDDQFDRLPKAAKASPRVKELEEWLCDFFARKIYKAYIEGDD